MHWFYNRFTSVSIFIAVFRIRITDTDRDPAFHFDANTDPTFHFDVDGNSDQSFHSTPKRSKIDNLEFSGEIDSSTEVDSTAELISHKGIDS